MTNANASPHSVLGLQPGADEASVRASYRRLVMAHHPDISDDKDFANARMAEINDAYRQILAGKDTRGRNTRESEPKTSPFTYDDFDDVMAREARRDAQAEEQRRREAAQSARERAAREQRVTEKARGRAQSAKQTRDDTVQAETPIFMSAAQRSEMNKALELRAKREIYRMVTAQRGGIYPDPASTVSFDPESLPSLHKAQKILVKGRDVEVHLGSRGTSGRNFVAVPRMQRGADGSISATDAIDVLDVALVREGKQSLGLADHGETRSSGSDSNLSDFSISLHFSDERQDLRADILGKSGRIKLR